MEKVVFCTLQVEGIHSWPGCNIEEVSYLKDQHRHMFHIKAYKKVTHADRDTEFIKLKHGIKLHFSGFYSARYKCANFKNMSCEHIAEHLVETFKLTACEVSEDGENGALVHI